MRDEREKGTYTETFKKVRNDITYTMKETTIIGRENVVLKIVREYNPGIVYPITWDNI